MCVEWNHGERRLYAELICCPHCGSTDVYRRGSKDGTGHWRCRACAQHWTEDLEVGRGKECNAKLETVLLAASWDQGEKRVEAEVVCCPACGCTKVRCSSTRSLIGYWYCSSCKHGWNELGEVARGRECRVKLAHAYAGLARPLVVPTVAQPVVMVLDLDAAPLAMARAGFEVEEREAAFSGLDEVSGAA